jgi:dephospho-CoA kinase
MKYLDEPTNKLDRIALCGPMTSGKSYASGILMREYGYVQFAFADKLKSVVSELLDINVTVKNNLTRQVLQQFSADCKRWRPDVWIETTLEEIAKSQTYGIEKFVIDDLRFIHEADILRENGFTIIRIDTPESVRMARVTKLYPDTQAEAHEHASEKEWLEIVPDFTISGEGRKTQEDLDEIIMFRKGSY